MNTLTWSNVPDYPFTPAVKRTIVALVLGFIAASWVAGTSVFKTYSWSPEDFPFSYYFLFFYFYFLIFIFYFSILLQNDQNNEL